MQNVSFHFRSSVELWKGQVRKGGREDSWSRMSRGSLALAWLLRLGGMKNRRLWKGEVENIGATRRLEWRWKRRREGGMFSLTAITERVGLGGMSTGVQKKMYFGSVYSARQGWFKCAGRKEDSSCIFSRQQGEHRKSLKQHRTHPLSRLSRAVVLHAATT